jgi:hypothetical protein
MIYLKIDDNHIGYRCTRKEVTPLDHILIAVVMCLGYEILEDKKLSVFGQISAHFGEECIKISCACKEDNKEDFMKAFSNCYILKNLKFKTEVSFTQLQ